jgi:hypothetical protein
MSMVVHSACERVQDTYHVHLLINLIIGIDFYTIYMCSALYVDMYVTSKDLVYYTKLKLLVKRFDLQSLHPCVICMGAGHQGGSLGYTTDRCLLMCDLL